MNILKCPKFKTPRGREVIIEVGPSGFVNHPERSWMAVHWERRGKMIPRPRQFFAESEEAARQMADKFEIELKEKYAKWHTSARARLLAETSRP